MCGKYVLIVGYIDDRMQSIVDICNQDVGEEQKILLGANGEISPDDNAPALFLVNHRAQATSMRWGFAGENGLVINARSEDIYNRPMFKYIADHQRCALPAAGYIEWRDGDKLRYMIAPPIDQSLYLAGLYRSDEKGNLRFVVLTRQAFGAHAKIHGRMPCLLHSREEARQWLSGAISIEMLSANRSDDLLIQAQGFEQLQMDFED